MRKTQFMVSALLLVLLLVACAPAAAPAPAPAPQTIAPTPAKPVAPVAPAKPAWQGVWERTLEAAKQEGRVVLHTGGGTETRTAVVTIAKLQGISAEITSTRPPEFMAKVLAERRAGLYFTDLSLQGPYPLLLDLKPTGILEPLNSVPILPDFSEVEKIQQVWYQGKFPWVDSEHTILRFSLQAQTPLAINSNLVKPDEIKSWRDVLHPKWQDKVIVGDPTIPGAGQGSMVAILELVGENFVKELAATKPIVMRDQRLMLEWLAQGKVLIAVAPLPEQLVEFLKIGAPIKVITPAEGTWLTSGTSGLAMLKNAPHPNASKVFINLLLSKEGQEIYAPLNFHQSLRQDVSTAHLPPERIRKEGVKYLDTNSEETMVRQPKLRQTAADIFKPLVK